MIFRTIVLIVSSIFLFQLKSLSQTLTTKYSSLIWTPELKQSGSIKEFIVGENQTLYFLRSSMLSKHYTAASIDAAMNISTDKEMVYSENDKEFVVTHMLRFNNRLLCLAYGKSAGKYTVVLFPVNEVTLEKTQPSISLFQTDEEVAWIVTKQHDPYYALFNTSYGYALSADESKIVIYNTAGKEVEGNFPVDIQVLDASTDKVWSKKVDLSFGGGNFSLKNVLLNNAGDVFLYGSVKIEKDKSKGQEASSYLLIGQVTEQGPDLNKKIHLTEKKISSYDVVINNLGKPLCAGFYGNTSAKITDGAFLISYDSDLSVHSEKTVEVANAIKEKMLPEDERDNWLLPHPVVYMGIQQNGDIVIVGQNSSVTTYSPTTTIFRTPIAGAPGQTMSTKTTMPGGENIRIFSPVVVRLTAGGELKFVAVVPIKQYGQFRDYMGSAVYTANDRIYFVFNDDPRNEKINTAYLLEFYKGGRNADVILAAVNPDGTVEKVPLISNKDLEATFVPRISTTLPDQKVILYGDYEKKFKIGFLSFK